MQPSRFQPRYIHSTTLTPTLHPESITSDSAIEPRVCAIQDTGSAESSDDIFYEDALLLCLPNRRPKFYTPPYPNNYHEEQSPVKLKNQNNSLTYNQLSPATQAEAVINALVSGISNSTQLKPSTIAQVLYLLHSSTKTTSNNDIQTVLNILSPHISNMPSSDSQQINDAFLVLKNSAPSEESEAVFNALLSYIFRTDPRIS